MGRPAGALIASRSIARDLSRLLLDLSGVGDIGRPLLETLLKKNKIEMIGAEEAAAFAQGKYVDLHRSTVRKIDVLQPHAAGVRQDPKTNATWKEAHGLSFQTVLNACGPA